MGLRARILRVVHPDGGGPRPRRILECLARSPREKARAAEIVDAMIERGELVMRGDRRGAKYGLPAGQARAKRRRRKSTGRRAWTDADIERLSAMYADRPTSQVARALERTVYAVNGMVTKLGLRKSADYLAEHCRLRPGSQIGKRFQFKPGHVPANKGLRRPGWSVGRMRETQFRKGARSGQAARNYMPLGATRLMDGYLYIKVAEIQNVAYTVNWKPLHILNWERANGRPLPDGFCLRFRDNDRMNVEPANLELISRRDNMLRNSIHNLPEPVVGAIRALGALNRKINRLEKRNGKNA